MFFRIRNRIDYLEAQLDSVFKWERAVEKRLAKIEMTLYGTTIIPGDRGMTVDSGETMEYRLDCVDQAVRRLYKEKKPKCVKCKQALPEPEYNSASPLRKGRFV